MVALSDLVFLARSAAGRVGAVAGNTITIALATLARGLAKAGDIDIDANGVGATTVTVRNSGAGVADLDVEGNVDAGGSVRGDAIISLNTVKLAGGTGFVVNLTGTPTADRTITFPDASGTVSLGDASGYLGSLTQAAILATTPSGFAWAFCNDTPGTAGGTTGAPVYWTPIPGVWLRYANDSPL